MNIFVTNSLEQGFMFAFMALGVLLTFRMMGFPDLTVEGSFPLGAAVTARLLVGGVHPVVAILAGTASGGLAGVFTGIIHTKLRVNIIVAGILTAAAIYTAMLRVMGRPNTPLLATDNVYGFIARWMGRSEDAITVVVIVFCLVILVLAGVYWFLHTDLGLAVRSTGNNERMSRALGVDTDFAKILVMGLSNVLVAFSGSLVAQRQGFADIGMGIGALVAAAASVIIGETIFGRRNVGRWLVGAIIGSLIYRVVLNVGLRVGLPATDFKAITAGLVLLALSAPLIQEWWQQRRGVGVPALTAADPATQQEDVK